MSLELQKDVPLKAYTTLKTGGVARYLAEVSSLEEVKAGGYFFEPN
jgi:UDP-N-acetylenolpyruvoylglucosamine reductase